MAASRFIVCVLSQLHRLCVRVNVVRNEQTVETTLCVCAVATRQGDEAEMNSNEQKKSRQATRCYRCVGARCYMELSLIPTAHNHISARTVAIEMSPCESYKAIASFESLRDASVLQICLSISSNTHRNGQHTAADSIKSNKMHWHALVCRSVVFVFRLAVNDVVDNFVWFTFAHKTILTLYMCLACV